MVGSLMRRRKCERCDTRFVTEELVAPGVSIPAEAHDLPTRGPNAIGKQQ